MRERGFLDYPRPKGELILADLATLSLMDRGTDDKRGVDEVSSPVSAPVIEREARGRDVVLVLESARVHQDLVGCSAHGHAGRTDRSHLSGLEPAEQEHGVL